MDNIFLIVSNDKITLDENINNLVKKYKDSEVVYYNLLNTPISRLIEDLDTFNFLSNKKIIVGTNACFLSSERVKSEVEHDISVLEKYLDNPSLDNILVLVSDTIDKRKKITATLVSKATVIEEVKDFNKIVKDRLGDYKISNSTLNKLYEYCMNDHERILNEIEKLKMYKIDTKEIVESDIEDAVMQSLDDNIFHFVDSILSGNKKYAFKLYNNFRLHGKNINDMLGLISSKIRLIYQVKVLVRDGNSDQTISKLLKVHEYPIKLARESSYKYSDKVLLDDLNKLAEIDYMIKSGKSDGEVLFETLLAQI